MAQLGILFVFCVLGDYIGGLLSFPGSVTAMLLLAMALGLGVVKVWQIGEVAGFLQKNMGFFFVVPCVGIMEHFQLISANLLAFFLIACATTPLIYALTAWSIQGLMKGKRGQDK